MRQPCTKYDDSIGSVTTVFEFQRTRKMKDMKNTTFAGCLFQVMATRNHWWNKSSHHWVQSNIPSTWSCDWLPTLPGMRKHIPPTIHPSWHSWRVFEDDHFPNFPVWWVPCDRFPWRVPARSTLRVLETVFFHPKKSQSRQKKRVGCDNCGAFATKKWSKVVLRLDKPWPTRWYGKTFYGKTIEQLGPVSIARFQLRLPEFPAHSS